jgi:hypothetical protein
MRKEGALGVEEGGYDQARSGPTVEEEAQRHPLGPSRRQISFQILPSRDHQATQRRFVRRLEVLGFTVSLESTQAT